MLGAIVSAGRHVGRYTARAGIHINIYIYNIFIIFIFIYGRRASGCEANGDARNGAAMARDPASVPLLLYIPAGDRFNL